MPKTFEDYAAELETRLEKSREAILVADDARMKASHADLRAFIEDSDDRLHGVTELDDIASNAMRDVTLARLDQSLVKNLIHLVYSTKHRAPWIPEDVRKDLWAYQAGRCSGVMELSLMNATCGTNRIVSPLQGYGARLPSYPRAALRG